MEPVRIDNNVRRMILAFNIISGPILDIMNKQKDHCFLSICITLLSSPVISKPFSHFDSLTLISPSISKFR